MVAHVDVTPYDDGGVTVTVWPTSQTETPDGQPDGLMLAAARAILRAAKAETEPQSQTALLELAKIKGRAETKRAALDWLVSKGCIAVELGPRRAHLHRYAHDVPDAEETTDA